MVDEKIFKHAVTLASAFIANGDIKCGGNTKKNTSPMQLLTDLISTLYSVVQDAQETVVFQQNKEGV